VGDNLNIASLEWAKTHIDKHTDSNLFPNPFEFSAINSNWHTIRDYLSSIDIDTYKTNASIRMLAPKGKSLFRVTHQLDPLDTLVYTTLVYEAADLIEKNRIDAHQRIACSYRISLTPNGDFFPPDNGWSNFHQRSKELAQSGEYSFVLLADINDFYNQANHHRIENALETASIDEKRAKTIEGFLGSLSAKQSRGLPVGARGSIILAEACLNDVDKHLNNKGLTFTRYVDDFRVFCKTHKDAVMALYYLTDYLNTSHRLSLQMTKTKIISVEKFSTTELRDPDEETSQAKDAKLKKIVDTILSETGYTIDIDDIPDQKKQEAIRSNLADLLKSSLSPSVNYPLAKYVLVHAARLRVRVIAPKVLDSLTALSTILPDAMNYLSAVWPAEPSISNEWGKKLANFLDTSIVGDLPYIRMWTLHTLAKRPNALPFSEMLRLAQHTEYVGLRYAALVAKSYKQVEWVRSYKEIWKNNGPWEQRAILWAGSILPRDERRSWLRAASEDSDLITRSVALLAIQG